MQSNDTCLRASAACSRSVLMRARKPSWRTPEERETHQTLHAPDNLKMSTTHILTFPALLMLLYSKYIDDTCISHIRCSLCGVSCSGRFKRKNFWFWLKRWEFRGVSCKTQILTFINNLNLHLAPLMIKTRYEIRCYTEYIKKLFYK